MVTAFPKYVPALLLSAIVTIACSESDLPLSPTTTTVTQRSVAAPVTVEPVAARAERLAERVCPAPPFGVRIVVVLSDRVAVVRRLHFALTHPTGERIVPLVFPLLTPVTPARPAAAATPLPPPTQSPVPMPTATGLPVPTPAAPPIEHVLLSVRRLPLFLEFPCDVPPAGTLVGTVDTTDDAGESQSSVLRVTVSG